MIQYRSYESFANNETTHKKTQAGFTGPVFFIGRCSPFKGSVLHLYANGAANGRKTRKGAERRDHLSGFYPPRDIGNNRIPVVEKCGQRGFSCFESVLSSDSINGDLIRSPFFVYYPFDYFYPFKFRAPWFFSVPAISRPLNLCRIVPDLKPGSFKILRSLFIDFIGGFPG